MVRIALVQYSGTGPFADIIGAQVAHGKQSPRLELDSEIRMLHERIAAVGSKAAEYQQSDRDLTLALELVSGAMWTTDDALRLQSCRGSYQAVLGGKAAPGVALTELLESGDMRLGAMRAALEGRETRATLLQGEQVFLFATKPLLDDAGIVCGLIGTAMDVTEQHRRQQTISNSEQRYRELFDNAGDLIFTHDPDGRLTGINRAVERMLGYTVAEALSMRLHDLLAPESQSSLDAHLSALREDQAPQTWEAAAVARSGKRVYLEISLRMLRRDGSPVAVEGIARDVTERRQLEEQVRQAQKMEAIGVLAGGIAHDFNNLLTGILGYAYVMQAEQDLNARQAESLDVIVKSAERAAQLTTQLLGFARRSKDQNIPVDVHEIVREMVDLLTRTIDKRISIATNLQARHHHVMGDPGQIYQLLLNLCLNARDAMPGGGSLSLATKSTGSTVVITVADTGEGIRADIRDRIFEPFFTTKPTGKGTGMGLAMVYGIARNHGGTIHVDTEVGRGSSFHITLPVCAREEEKSGPKQQAEPGAGRVLVVDDEEVVRQVLTRMLRGLGYEAVVEGDPHRAVEYYKHHAAEIDLVILDMMMPKLTGREVYHALHSVNPGVRVVLSSGYSRDDSAEELVKEARIEFLPKPYQMHQLGAVLRKTLGRAGPQPGSGPLRAN